MESVNIAVEGCCHGELDKIYETVSFIEKRHDMKIDLLICCGDFQAVRNTADLECMAVPPKYRQMQTFYKYYSGEKVAPVLTIFIGGNHEASNHLWELSYGGWVAPNIYYLGRAGIVNFGGIRIGGLSGIYKSHDYNKGLHECPPFNSSTCRSIYHIRAFDVFKLKLVSGAIDVFLSHDWPRGIYYHGNVDELLRRKPFFREEVDSNTLGNPPAEELLHCLKPSYWFAAHLHVKFAAVVTHEGTMDDSSGAGQKLTKFLALDKCLPRRDFLQIMSIPASGPKKLQYDAEWLAITKATQAVCSFSHGHHSLPTNGSNQFQMYGPTEGDMKAIREAFGGDLTIPCNFCLTSPVHDPLHTDHLPIVVFENPQTAELCQRLDIENPFRPGGQSSIPPHFEEAVSTYNNPDEISLSDTEEANVQQTSNTRETVTAATNLDEINLDNSDEDSVEPDAVCEETECKVEQSHNEPEAKRSCPGDINDSKINEGSGIVEGERMD